MMVASAFLTVMATLFLAITFALDVRGFLNYFTAGFGLLWSIGEVIFSVVRRSLGLHHPTTKIWVVLVVNIVMLLCGASVVVLIAFCLGPVNLRIGVPFFGIALFVTMFEALCLIALIQNRRYRENQIAISDSSIKSSLILTYRLAGAIVVHAITFVPAYYYYHETDIMYVVVTCFAYIGLVIIINAYGFYAAKQSSELSSLVIYFIAGICVAFLGAFLLLLICDETSSYEVGVHPLIISVSLFGSGIVAWLTQVGCIHRAWLLIKYKKKLRKSLDFHYTKKFRDDDEGFSDLATTTDFYGDSSPPESDDTLKTLTNITSMINDIPYNSDYDDWDI